jgi:large subunit ribosomal protein L4
VLVPDQLNTYDVLCADDIVFTQGSLSTFLAGPTKGKSVQAAVSDAPVQDVTTGADDVEDTK